MNTKQHSSAWVKSSTSPLDAKAPRARQGWAWPYLLVTALVVPLLYSSATIDPVEPLRFLVIALLGIVTISTYGFSIMRRSTTLSLNRPEAIVIGCLTAYILLAGISVLAAGPKSDGIFEILKLATFGWLIYASSRAIGGDESALALLGKLAITATLMVGGFALLQYYQVAVFEWMKRDTTVDSTMGHRNLLASWLTLTFPFVIYVFFELHGRWRIASAVTMLLSIFLMIVLQTRSVWVAFPVALACSLFLLVLARTRGRPAEPRGPYRPRLIQGALLAALAFGLALLLYSPASRAPMGERAGSLVQLQQASIQERLQLWSRTLRMIRDHPFTGVGLGNWRVAIPTYGAEGMRSDTGTLHFQRPHNDFLWAASEVGVLGGLLYLALFGSVLGLTVQATLRTPSAHHRLVFLLVAFGVSCYGIDSLFSFPKERLAHVVYLALLIGTLLSFHPDARDRPAVLSFSRRWTIAIVALVGATTLVAGHFALARYRAEVHLRRALEARAVQDWPVMISELDHIDRRCYTMDSSSAPIAWYRGVARFEMGDREAAFADFRSALAVHPNHVHVLNNIATCEALQGDYDEAVRTYTRAIQLAPRFEEARTNLGSLLHSLGRDRQAYEVLAPCAASATSPRFRECFRTVRATLGLQD